MIILHGVFTAERPVDPIAIKIAESEKIPLVTTAMPIEELTKMLSEFEK